MVKCYTIGIGRGCDGGLVEGIANSSGGQYCFVQEGESISEKVINKLESSLYPNLTSAEIHIDGENNDAFQVSPFPLPIISYHKSCTFYLRCKKQGDKNIFEDKNFLITAKFSYNTVEISIEEQRTPEKINEDKYGCSNGKNIGKSIFPLFAFNLLKIY